MVKNGGHNFFVWIIYWKWIWHHIYWRYNWFHNSRGIFPVLNLSKIYFGLLFFPNQFIENGRCGIRENMREAFFVSRYFIEGRFGFLIQCWWRVFIGKYLIKNFNLGSRVHGKETVLVGDEGVFCVRWQVYLLHNYSLDASAKLSMM